MPLIYYVEINLICIVLLTAILWFHTRESFSESLQEGIFRRAIGLTILLCISDLASQIAPAVDLPGMMYLNIAANTAFYGVSVLLMFCLATFVFARLETLNRVPKTLIMLYHLPLILFMVLLAVNLKNGMLFRIAAGNIYERGPYVWIHWIVCVFYFLGPAAVDISTLYGAQNRNIRDDAPILLAVILFPLAGALLQAAVFGLAAVQPGITAAIFFVFCATQTGQIMKDEMTGLNNRRAMRRFINERLGASDRSMLSVMVFDMDDFKHINDSCGHLAGDQALIRTAGALKIAAGETERRCFLCRYAGDEFVMILEDAELPELHRLKNRIREELRVLNAERRYGYTLNVSIGISSGLCCEPADFHALFQKADEAMYKEKESKKRKDA